MQQAFLKKIRAFIDYHLVRKTRNRCLKWLGLQWKLRSGLRVKVENQVEWVIYNDIFVDGEYDLPIQQTIASASSSDSLFFLDIGANVGFFTLRVADLLLRSDNSPKFSMLLVEGGPHIYETLISRLTNEEPLKGKLQIVHGLVGNRVGSDVIVESDFHGSSSIYTNDKTKGVIVPYIDIDTVCPRDKEIDLLKCDIEGAELVFIKNYPELFSRVNSAVFEFHHDIYEPAECIQMLKDFGLVNHLQLRSEVTYSVHYFWR